MLFCGFMSLPTVRRLIKELALLAFLPQSFRAAARRYQAAREMVGPFPHRALQGVGYRPVAVQITVPFAVFVIREVRKSVLVHFFEPIPVFLSPVIPYAIRVAIRISLWTRRLHPIQAARRACPLSPQNTSRRHIPCPSPFQATSRAYSKPFPKAFIV